MTRIVVLGARGRIGRAVAKAFIDAGYEVRGVTRDGKLPEELAGATGVAADALDRRSLIEATRDAEIVFNSLSPIYSDWSTCIPMAENVMAACAENGARHFFPGTVYNFGSPIPAIITEDTPQAPTTEKGRIRVAMEDLFRREAGAGRVRTAILRAGDFFGGKGTGAWFDLIVASKCDKGGYTAPGKIDPGLAAAFVALADNRDKLGDFESLNCADHAVTDLDMKSAAQCALGECLELASMPWWVLRLGSPFNPMWKAILSMAYLRFEPHRLAPGRPASIIGTVPHTSLEKAVAGAIADLGIVPEKRKLAA
ncbi:MAG: NAD(P)H-binding protein [Rhizobiales bacterium]|nr:NAD(P)H-binding protein [Hyphomicrobiales bacterium]